MQYLLMCCFDESKWASFSEEKRDEIMQEYGQLLNELKESGTLLAGAKLDQCTAAATVRRKNGKPLVVDGPFAETKEQLGGYHLIECKDRDEAVSVAMRIPTLDSGGTVEVRRVLHTE